MQIPNLIIVIMLMLFPCYSIFAMAGKPVDIVETKIVVTKVGQELTFTFSVTQKDNKVLPRVPVYWFRVDRKTLPYQFTLDGKPISQLEMSQQPGTPILKLNMQVLEQWKDQEIGAYYYDNSPAIAPITKISLIAVASLLIPPQPECNESYISFEPDYATTTPTTLSLLVDPFTGAETPFKASFYISKTLSKANQMQVTSSPLDYALKVTDQGYSLNASIQPREATNYSFILKNVNYFGETKECKFTRSIKVNQVKYTKLSEPWYNIPFPDKDLVRIGSGYTIEFPTHWSHFPIRSGTASIGNKLYVLGGEAPQAVNDFSVMGLNTERSAWKWIRLPSLPLAGRARPLMISLMGKIVAFGGYVTGSDSVLYDGATFDPATNVWTNMPTASGKPSRYNRVIAGNGTHTGKALFCTDGSETTKPAAQVLIYDAAVNSLTAIYPPTGLTQFTGKFFWEGDNIIYLDRDSNLSGIYDVNARKWIAQLNIRSVV